MLQRDNHYLPQKQQCRIMVSEILKVKQGTSAQPALLRPHRFVETLILQ